MLLVELLNGKTMNVKNRIRPDTMSIQLKTELYSTASMTIADTEPAVNVGDWVHIIAPNGE